MKQTLYFTATAQWVTDAVVVDVPKHAAATAEAKRTGPANSGTLVLTADNRAELDKAVAYLARDCIYKHHFRTTAS